MPNLLAHSNNTLPINDFSSTTGGLTTLMLCLEVWRKKRVEGKGGKERRGMVIPSPCLDVLKIR